MRRSSDRIAVISDVHGNLTALEAVLQHIREQAITRIFNLGDLIGKGPRSAEAVDRCRAVCEVVLQGNWDALVSEGPDESRPTRQLHRAQLGPDRLAYLAALPGVHNFVLSGQRVRLFHASQVSVFHRVRVTDSPDVHRAMFENTDFTGWEEEPRIVGYGDIHKPYLLGIDGRTLFNVGSVGNPLDIPSASYVVLEGVVGSSEPAPWSIHIIRLPYDIEAELAVAKASGMPDLDHYETELRTARYRGLTPSTSAA
jgi:protein phosphatase